MNTDAITTKQLEHLAYKNLWKIGTYLCFEVAMPAPDGSHMHQVKERVDLLSYDTKGIWRFYELKVSKQDFYSKCACTFYGHFNYFIMPQEIYEQVKQDIPDTVGVYIPVCNNKRLSCISNPKRQELKVDHNFLMFNLMQAFSREYKKYRKILEELNV